MISVVIMAHNRRNFLLYAVKSVLNQIMIDKDKYEIIVVKNFEDDNIDRFLEQNNVINIIEKDYRQGAKIFRGAKEAKHSIIALLDDDDMFHNTKLNVILQVFSTYRNVIYYHNNFATISSKGEPVPNPFLLIGEKEFRVFSTDEKLKYIDYFDKFHISINNSSIVIKKDLVIQYENIKLLENLSDYALFFAALDSKGDIVTDGRALTYYRLHSGQSDFGGSLDSLHQFMENYANTLERKIRSINLLCDTFKHNISIYNFCLKKRRIFYLLYLSLIHI